GQEVYGAGIAFGIVPRQYFKVEKADFILFSEYPLTNFRLKQNQVILKSFGDSKFVFRLVILPIDQKKVPKLTVKIGRGKNAQVVSAEKGTEKTNSHYYLNGDSEVVISW